MAPAQRAYETQQEHFDYERYSPLEFLEYLKLGRQEAKGPFTSCMTVWSCPDSWIRREHLAPLADLLDSDEPCAAVVSAISSTLPWGGSTVGREAAFLMAGFRQGRYPPGLHSGTVNIAAVKAWWQAYGVDTSPDQVPLVRVYAEGQLPVEQVRVAITNPYHDRAILITSLEFDGQLPELRYFYHGVYGSIRRQGANYVHSMVHQQLSQPVGSCFLLPRQSINWRRPMRVTEKGYHAYLTWREIHRDEIPTSIWFCSGPRTPDEAGYESLTEDRALLYRNLTAGNDALPRVIVEGEFPARICEMTIPCVVANPQFPGRRGGNDALPRGTVNFLLPSSIADSVLVADNKVTFRKYNRIRDAYEPVASPHMTPAVVDLLFLACRSAEKTIPCILSQTVFGDLLEVKEPSTKMYYDPGITPVPLETFSRILDRAREHGLAVVVKRIDPNSLGRRHVLVIGVEVDGRGRRVGADSDNSSPP